MLALRVQVHRQSGLARAGQLPYCSQRGRNIAYDQPAQNTR